jgi:nucleoid DNA-binding protein
MQELIDKLKEKAGLSEEQAMNAINAIKDYITEKFPMLEGALENMFGKRNQQ